MEENIIEVTDENFEEVVINSDKPVAVLFHPGLKEDEYLLFLGILRSVADDFGDKMLFVEAEHDQNRIFAKKYGVSSRHTDLLFFKNGQKIDQIMGVSGILKVDAERYIKSILYDILIEQEPEEPNITTTTTTYKITGQIVSDINMTVQKEKKKEI